MIKTKSIGKDAKVNGFTKEKTNNSNKSIEDCKRTINKEI